MKNYIKMTAAAVLLIAAAVILFLIVSSGTAISNDSGARERITALNDIARTAEDHRSELVSPSKLFDDTAAGCDFVILDMTDNVLYSHTTHGIPDEKLSVETAIQKRYPYQYLTDDSGVWGSVILLDDGIEGYRTLRYRFAAGIGICGALLLIAAAGFGIYIRKNIILPFRRLQKFAGRIAEGDLGKPLEMDKENLFGAFSESFDIMREELADSKKRELELQKKERELVASLSHDLKTPVTGIKLAAELLQMRLSVKADTESEDTVFSRQDIDSMFEDAQGILHKAEQIDVLVSDLFTSTLDDLGEFKVNCRDENSKVLCDIIKNCDDRHLTAAEELPEVIICIDRKRMAQVIGNIISNSYKYADTQIDISYGLSEGFLEMRIHDRGQGVPDDEIDLITNKFYRGRQWMDSSTEGNGLGLYIARMLMKKMNGDLIAENDDGLAVTLVIPLS